MSAALTVNTDRAPHVLQPEDQQQLVNHDLVTCSPLSTVVLDGDRTIRQVSDAFGRRDLIGFKIDDLFARNVVAADAVREAIARAVETRKVKRIQGLAVNDGAFWTIRVMPIYKHALQYIVVEMEDTTEEHLRQLELEERMFTNETFRILVETVKDYAIFMLDPNGNIRTWNAGARRFKGYTKEEIVGKHFSIFYGQEDRDNDKPGRELTVALREGRLEDEGWRLRKDGSRFFANVVITPVHRGDTLIGFSKVTRDLTERRAAESRLISAYEEAAKLKSEFLANMSHEIRTPMNGLLSALTLLLDTSLTDEQLDLAKIMKESGQVLLQVINDILDYSKLASGCFSISSDLISVPDIIESVMRSLRTTACADVVLESFVDPRLPKSSEGDPLRYRQIIQNLVSNATKFTDQGYVHIRAVLKEEDEDSILVLTEVIDTGIGVPFYAVSALFTPFTQFDNSTTKRYKGTGLGLSICKSLAQLMGGEIGFRANLESHGSVFWFTCRLRKIRRREQLDALSVQLQPAAGSAAPELKRIAPDKRILLAEDNIINRRVMTKMLKGLGFPDIDSATDGKEAVELTTSQASGYDLVLMDINMPILDGVAATKEIRNAGFDMPIVAMTANALKGQAESYLAKGLTDYVSKPVDREFLAQTLLKYLSRKPSA